MIELGGFGLRAHSTLLFLSFPLGEGGEVEMLYLGLVRRARRPPSGCMGVVARRGWRLSHRLQIVEVHPIGPEVPVVALVVSPAANIEMRRVDAETVMATMTNDLFEAGGDVVQGTVDKSVGLVLGTPEADLSDSLGLGDDTACVGCCPRSNKREGPLTGLLCVVRVDDCPPLEGCVEVNEVFHDHFSDAQRTSQTAFLEPSGPMMLPRSRT